MTYCVMQSDVICLFVILLKQHQNFFKYRKYLHIESFSRPTFISCHIRYNLGGLFLWFIFIFVIGHENPISSLILGSWVTQVMMSCFQSGDKAGRFWALESELGLKSDLFAKVI